MAYSRTDESKLTAPSIGSSVSQIDISLKKLDEVMMRLIRLEDHINGTGPKVVSEPNGINEKMVPSIIAAINGRASRLSDIADGLDAVSTRIEELIGSLP